MKVEELVREVPASIPAEQGVIGSLLVSTVAWDDVNAILADGDFFRPGHRLIYRKIAEMASKGEPVDVITLAEALQRAGWLDEVGGLAYLASLAKETPSAANAGHYATVVREKAVLRSLIDLGAEIANLAHFPEGRSVDDVLAAAEAMVAGIADRQRGSSLAKGWIGYREIMAEAIGRVEVAFHRDSNVTGLSTGFADLDDMTMGLQPADLVIVAGRPSMGKTSFAMQIAEHTALNQSAPVAVFSMEMPAGQLGSRSLASHGSVPFGKIRSGKLAGQDWPRLTAALSSLADIPLVVDDRPALSPADVRSALRRLAREKGNPALVVVDYLQLMRVPGLEKNRVQEVSEISRSLKAIAKEFNCPVVALSQLNRSLENRPNKRPVMSDLRDSGAVEQDADLILFVYRDEVYNPDTQDKGKAEIIIGKQRNGPLGTANLAFQGEYVRFFDRAPEPMADAGRWE